MSGSLTSILSNASSGLGAAQAGIATVGNNIANAGVAGYTAKTQQQTAFLVGGGTQGVRTGLVTRSVDSALQASAWSQASRVAALGVRSQVLTSIDATQGTPGQGASLSDAVTALHNGFTQLQSTPSSQTAQSAAVSAATTLAGTVNATAGTIAAQRNALQADIVTSVETLNTALGTIQSTTASIIAARSAGQDTAALEDKRDAALLTVSGLIDVHYVNQKNGDIAILGDNGLSIPLDGTFSTQAATLQPGSTTASGGVPPILLQSANLAIPAQDVTSQLTGGALGERIQLRDSTLPSYTASLDAFSAKLANQFSAQGIRLFGDGSGSTTLSAYAGLSSVIAVNPAVTANPAAVRDGTAGTSYPVNPAGGPAGYTGLIDRVLDKSFAAGAGATSLSADANAFVAQQSGNTAQAGTDLTAATAYQTTLTSRFSAQSGVNVDQEMGLMIQLQNSYQANARVIQTLQSMFSALMNIATA